MPTPTPLHRTYCKVCNDFTIHQWTSNDDLNCIKCNTKETGYNINDVDAELIKEQRARYIKSKRLGSVYNKFLLGIGLEYILSPEFNKINVIECPAGQDQIDENYKLKLRAVKLARLEKLNDYNDNYKHLGRNDLCACGSGKKYKHCHFKEFN